MSGDDAASALRRRLLPPTIRHAATKVPAYRALYADVAWADIESVGGLGVLPIIDKKTVSGAWTDFICPGLTLSHVQHTTGTTGDSLFILRSVEEQNFITTFMSEAMAKPVAARSALVMEEGHHGAATGLPSPFHVLKGSITDDRAIETSLRLLNLPNRLPRQLPPVNVLIGTDTAVRALTHLAAQRMAKPSEAGIMVVHTYGDLMPSKIRQRIERTWSAVLVDRYSMVENFGGASLLPGTDYYHFDPHLVPEVVDARTHRPLRAGRGVLVLTSLYPFVQMMPMVRYNTGDAVEIVACGEEFSSLKLRVLGRLSDCLCDEDGIPVLTPKEWREAIEDIPGVAFHSRRCDLGLPGIVRAIGRPLVRFRSVDGLTRINGTLAIEEGRDPRAVLAAAEMAILEHAPLLAERVRLRLTEFRLSGCSAEAFTCETP